MLKFIATSVIIFLLSTRIMGGDLTPDHCRIMDLEKKVIALQKQVTDLQSKMTKCGDKCEGKMPQKKECHTPKKTSCHKTESTEFDFVQSCIVGNPNIIAFGQVSVLKRDDTIHVSQIIPQHRCYVQVIAPETTLFISRIPIKYKQGQIIWRVDTSRIITMPVFKECVPEIPKEIKMMNLKGRPRPGTGKF